MIRVDVMDNVLDVETKCLPEELSQCCDDVEIKKAYLEDKEKGFRLLVNQYMRLLFCHAYRMLRDAESAREVSQDVFLKAFQNPEIFTREAKVKYWLLRVTSNLCIDKLRHLKRRSNFMTQTRNTPKENRTVENDLIEIEEDNALSKAIDGLQPHYKNIVILRYKHNLSYQEIADTLDIKIGTVMSRLNRARLLLTRSVA